MSSVQQDLSNKVANKKNAADNKWLSVWDFLKIDRKISEQVFFKIPRTCDRLMGIWPGDMITSKLQYFHISFFIIVSTLAAISQWAYIYKNIKTDLNGILEVIIPSSSLSVTLIKTVILLANRSKLRRIISILHQEWFNGNISTTKC